MPSSNDGITTVLNLAFRLPVTLSRKLMYRMVIFRFAQVHFESVNTVLLRKQNPDPVNYVLISGEAVVSMRKNTVVSAETTLMPHIPSMAAILCGLFAPVFETRLVGSAGCVKLVLWMH